jgi:hypothetical protein
MQPRCSICWSVQNLEKCSKDDCSNLLCSVHINRYGHPPFCGASRRFIVPSRACTNSALPRGRPVRVHRRISVSLDSISPAARYFRHALAVQLFRHSSKSKASFRDSAPQCAAALDHAILLHVRKIAPELNSASPRINVEAQRIYWEKWIIFAQASLLFAVLPGISGLLVLLLGIIKQRKQPNSHRMKALEDLLWQSMPVKH